MIRPIAGDSGVVVNFENRALPLVAVAQLFLEVFGIGHHRAKLVAVEAAAFGAGAFRGVDDRTGRVQPDEQGHDRHERTGQHQTERRTRDVQQTLQKQAQRSVGARDEG